ncbi:MAG TPA: ChaN family lipoprotein, partial [Limnobacter sp.]|nr:ChaN family lipoprotein [Limnobacter sp.]
SAAGGCMPGFVVRISKVMVLLGLGIFPGLSSSHASPRIMLLGEVHDNAEGHKARYELLASEVKSGWRPALAMEQFDREHQALLDEAMARCKTAACITSQPGLEKWDWALYQPLLQLALDYRLPILAANLSRNDANRIVKGGYSAALEPATIQRYQLDQPLPENLLEQHRKNIVQGHCNMLPTQVAEKMIPAQVARDVWMASVVEQQAARSDVVLIAGNGHVQRDVGVIRWLPVNLQRVTEVHGFVEHAPSAAAVQFDRVHRLPEQDREDPCEVFKTMSR